MNTKLSRIPKEKRFPIYSPRVFKALVAKDLLPIDMAYDEVKGTPIWIFKKTSYFTETLTEITKQINAK